MPKKRKTAVANSSFFENKDCEYYPCHPGMKEINCLFCYCPWFWDCGIKDSGMSCPDCTFPHQRDLYPYVMEGLKSMYNRRKIEVDNLDTNKG